MSAISDIYEWRKNLGSLDLSTERSHQAHYNTGGECHSRRPARNLVHGKMCDSDHVRMNGMGVICPRRGDVYAMEFTHSDTDCFQVYLDQANQDISWERPRNLLILDNASWHKTKSLKWGRFESVYLPPYSPDLNPIERLWFLIKAQWFSDFVAKTAEDLIAHLDKTLLWAMGRQEGNRQTCTIKQEL
jgi:hypothetical protein